MYKLMVSFLIVVYAAGVMSKEDHSDREKKEDIARHHIMAAAHEAAAQCLESGKKTDECWKALRDACKGVAVGKYCGMKHQH
jgi:hypothetical protein